MQIGTAIGVISQRACSGKSEIVSAPKEGGFIESSDGVATLELWVAPGQAGSAGDPKSSAWIPAPQLPRPPRKSFRSQLDRKPFDTASIDSMRLASLFLTLPTRAFT